MTADHHQGRELVLDAVRQELLGPAPHGTAVDIQGTQVTFNTLKESYEPHVESGTGEEILGWDRPLKRYGAGVLFPVETTARQARADDPSQALPDLEEDHADEADGTPELEPSDDLIDASTSKKLADLGKRIGASLTSDDGPPDSDGHEDLDLTGANLRKPSTLGISFAVELPPAGPLSVSAAGGRYRKLDATVTEDGRRRHVYARSPWSIEARFDAGDLRAKARSRVTPSASTITGLGELPGSGGPLAIDVEAFARPLGGDTFLITVTLLNRSTPARPGYGSDDTRCAFQVEMTVTPTGDGKLLPYPSRGGLGQDEEEASFDLLYRDSPVFAIGHGCAADWDVDGPATSVHAVALPTYEVPSITPDVTRPDGEPLSIEMAPLAGYVDGRDGFDDLEELVDLYEDWITRRRDELHHLDEGHQATGKTHLDRCEGAAARMRRGLELLKSDEQVRTAFQLANAAILLQQLRSTGLREVAGADPARGRILFDPEMPQVDPTRPQKRRGRWRAFQIAFFLMSLASTANGDEPDRETVELIWFPTGGGKTEAYLGLTAFSLFLRRLRDPEDTGVDVLMRYTLRLLTAQQFQRAARLICAMDHLRQEHEDLLGTIPYSIGIWVGSSTTPNQNKQAVAAYKAIAKGTSDRNPFLLTECPWCGARMGLPKELRGRGGRGKHAKLPPVLGARLHGDTVRLHCPDALCQFSSGLPVHVTDEAVYEHRPSLVIGTVDKFAMMAWREEPRRLFGIGEDGHRLASPPNLIIQDELHLISGPLGSLVGLYEMVIEELATDHRGEGPVKPKLVTSTATIRRYQDQVRALYARDEVELFPAPGLDAGDSFFATYARRKDGTLEPGRRYLGVHATNHTSLITTQINVMAALLQAPMELPVDARDPWWTQLAFFNNLRELGSSLSLVASNVPMQVRAIGDRTGWDLKELRRVREVMELTSRLQSHEVPTAIQRLEIPAEEGTHPVDICLASNIIEVGIDIDRLSLMLIVGQPKTTSQYIQVSGRVGRRWEERPGLVVTLLNPGRPRDRSHFEQFRAYHQRLYAQVEPTSVTPFSPPALDRALHGAMVAFVRQRTDRSQLSGPNDVPQELLNDFGQLAKQRVQAVDATEANELSRLLDKRLRELRDWGRMRWESPMGGEEVGMLSNPGQDNSHVPDAWTWPTPTSMRTVDAECEVDITKGYAHVPEEVTP